MRNNNGTLVFIGTIKKEANCGESMKNHLFIERFKELFDKVISIDIFQPKKHPFCFLKVILAALIHRKDKIVLSVSPATADKFIRLLLMLRCRNIYYWSVGVLLMDYFQKGWFEAANYNRLKAVYVQSPKMVAVLNACGVNNVIYVPNSKRIDYIPELREGSDNNIRFVFLSRIHPDKGCSEIIEAVRQLNDNGKRQNYIVDFYGTIASGYEEEFYGMIEDVPNVSYKGFLDLKAHAGYDILSGYDAMLFPTYYDGEAFPGVVIDAFVASLPVIATDWHFNKDIIDSEVGIIIPIKDVQSIRNAMLSFIDGSVDIQQFRRNSRSRAMQYDNRIVLSVENLKKIGFLS